MSADKNTVKYRATFSILSLFIISMKVVPPYQFSKVNHVQYLCVATNAPISSVKWTLLQNVLSYSSVFSLFFICLKGQSRKKVCDIMTRDVSFYLN
jgi:hypothetical protein